MSKEHAGSTTADHPGVAVHPPLFFLSALVVAFIVNWMWPLPIFGPANVRWAGLAGVVLGIMIIAAGRVALKKAGTNINPTKPVTALVRSGPYRFSRNPLYLGLTLIYLGLSVALNTWWAVGFLVPVWLVMHFAVVRREERYLEGKFGDVYRQYRATVRRYL
jgi:protein-S-isoprenylcysteine O-methyltransferase Ste14